MLLAACQPQTVPETGLADDPARWPEFDFAGAAAEGALVFQLIPEKSQIDIVVRREGPLARFGHDHAISAQKAAGFILPGEKPGEPTLAELRFRMDELVIDTAELRDRYQLDTNPDSADIEATRENLLDKVFEADRWPFISIKMSDFRLEDETYSALVETLVKGTVSRKRQAFQLLRNDNEVMARGSLTIRQSELGIEPFSILGGGLRVADPMEIHFILLGNPL
jgi:hypothetical protein